MTNQQALSLTTLLRQVRSMVRTTPIPADQLQQTMQAVSEILQTCARTTRAPLPERDRQEIRGQNHITRTVGTHLTSISTKLWMDSRTAAAEKA